MSSTKRGVRRSRNLFERVVLAVSLAAVASIVAGLLAARFSGANGPADLRATVAATGVAASGGRVYEVTIRNVGGETAENVVLEVTLGGDTRELEILSVARGDEERATVVFPTGAAGEPSVEVLSYHETTRG